MRQLFISAAHKSSGKTLLTTGICRLLQQRGYDVQPFKKGPDYIDPMWLSLASGRACYNLDFWTQSRREIQALYGHKSNDADFSIIEANKGLYDGLDLDGSNSNAALAKLLGTPVVLVLDCRGTIRGVAPLILGYQAFDPGIHIAGVILNFVGGSRHESKLRRMVNEYTDVPVLGAVARNDTLSLEERYLGLMPSNEDPLAQRKIDRAADLIGPQLDIDALIDVCSESSSVISPAPTLVGSSSYQLTVAYALDEAFGFYYADDLEMFQKLGARLVRFDTLHDCTLPQADALFIGGGFPEKRITQLSANRSLREQIRNAIANGMPAYAECGGLMYLSRCIHYNGQSGEMVGVIPADTLMGTNPQGRGYIEYRGNARFPWPGKSGKILHAHEFHYSHLQNLPSDLPMVFDVSRGHGVDGKHDGLVINNMLACYAHQRHTENNPWIEQFLAFSQQTR